MRKERLVPGRVDYGLGNGKKRRGESWKLVSGKHRGASVSETKEVCERGPFKAKYGGGVLGGERDYAEYVVQETVKRSSMHERGGFIYKKY